MRGQQALFLMNRVIGLASLALAVPALTLAEEMAPAAKGAKPQYVVGRAAIAKALGTPIKLQVVDTALDAVVAAVAKQIHVRMLLDERALGDAGVAKNEPVSLDVAGVPAREVFARLCQQLDMTLLIYDHYLLVTTPEAAEAAVETVSYDVTDLVMRQGASGKWYELNIDDLVDELTATVKPDSWETVGGPGSIRTVELPLSAVLVCLQTQEAHAEIEKLLTQLRKHEAQRRGTATLAVPGPEILLRRWSEWDADAQFSFGESRFALPARDERDRLIGQVNHFAWDLFQRLKGRPDVNLLFSPAGATLCLGLLRAGAKEETGEELDAALHLRSKSAGGAQRAMPNEQVTPAFALFFESMRAQRQTHGYDLQMATCFARPAGQRCLLGFGKVAKQFGIELLNSDSPAPSSLRQEVDAWTADAMRGTPTDRMPRTLVERATGGVLRNVVSFHGNWETPFKPLLTAPAEFKAGAKRWQVPMMASKEDLKYAEIDGVQMVEKPYLGGAISMVVLLPRDEAGALVELEKRLNATTFDQWLRRLSSVEVRLFLPRFRLEQSLDLKPPLIELGLKAAFTRGKANFKGIDDTASPPLSIEYFDQHSEIEVEETGTRAPCLTTAGLDGSFGDQPLEPKPIIFRADHPFLFLLRDVRTGAILFIGRYAVPTETAKAGA